jgi:Plasmid encoded RepA protein
MADATDGPDYSAQLEKACRLYAEFGYSPARIAAQLIRSGYPLSLIRARFPSLPTDAFADVAGKGIARTERKTAPTLNVGALLPPRIAAPLAGKLSPGVLPALTTGISFQYVPLIQCSFPHADPGDTSTFTRRNGWLELTLSATRRETGLPYGVPARLLTIYCASEAVRTRSPEIYLGKTVHEFLRCLDVPITRGERGSLRVYANQLLRLIHCAVSIDENIRDAAGRTGLHIRQALFAEEARLWWDESDLVGQGSSLVLSSVLFESILERSAPLSTAAIRQLRKSPMDLDVYAWLVHRLFNLSRSNTVTWAQLSGQFGHGYAEPRKFRHFFLDSLKRVMAVYPEANVKPAEVGLVLAPSRPHVPRDHRALAR